MPARVTRTHFGAAVTGTPRRHACALGSVEGFEADIRLTHARLCLSAGRRAEAYAILERARSELEQMAEQIDGSERRRRFLLMVESNAAIFRLSGARS